MRVADGTPSSGPATNSNVVAAERELSEAGRLIELAARRLNDATQMHNQRRTILASRAVCQLISDRRYTIQTLGLGNSPFTRTSSLPAMVD